jgi:hypothetical protein
MIVPDRSGKCEPDGAARPPSGKCRLAITEPVRASFLHARISGIPNELLTVSASGARSENRLVPHHIPDSSRQGLVLRVHQ